MNTTTCIRQRFSILCRRGMLALFLLLFPAVPGWSAIATDVTVSTNRSSSGTTITSPSFSTTSANELLLAFVSTDGSSGVRVTGVSGANLTWALVKRTNVQLGTAEIWRAYARSPLAGVTARATLSQSVAASITVVSFTGVDQTGSNGAGAIGATGGGSASSGAPTASLVTTRANSLIYGVGVDWDRAVARTPGPNQSMVNQYLASVGDTYWVQRQVPAPLPAGTRVTINDTAPTNDRFNLSIVEVREPEVPGPPAATVSTTALAFGNQPEHVASAPQTVTLSNTGTSSLSINSIGVTGTNGGDFSLSYACGTALAPGASCPIGVTFTPGATGPREAALGIATNDPVHASLSVALGGTGTGPGGPVGLAIDAMVSADRSTAASSVTTTSLSTRFTNELLLAFVSADALSSGSNTTVSGISNTGTPLTWELVRRTNAQMGTAEVWRAFATAPVTGTVTASFNQSVPASSLTVVSFTGADISGANGSGAIGATASGSASTGAPTSSLVSTRDNSWIFGVGTDWDKAINRTPGPNQTMVHQYLATVGDTYWVQRQTGLTPLAGTTVTLNDTAPTTDRYNLTIVEVRSPQANSKTLVNSLEDLEAPPAGVVTLRQAINDAAPGEAITFDPELSGGTIRLSLVGSSHSVLKGEIYSGMTYQGYGDRDYGRSALYARKDLVIDASALPDGIKISWTGGSLNPARVLAVYGNLTMKNVTITSGISTAEPLSEGSQPYTLARGGGLAVWGTATLERCTIAGNKVVGDDLSSRDRGSYGGGIYANGLDLKNCVISGNSATGYGAAGGGIYSVGGADNPGGGSGGGVGNDTTLTGCTVSGNRVTAQHAYGGGIFTLSGGPDNRATMHLTNCTVARNLVEDNPALPEPVGGQYYYRGGGIYMGGGSLELVNCTVVENEVAGPLAIISGKPNIGGGGVAATIGNAHVVEDVWVQHSIVAGNKVNGAVQDWYSGSLLNFYSNGYNLIGVLDFSQILVPVPDYIDLSRKHYPKVGDVDGVQLDQALSLAEVHLESSIVSAGTDSGQPAVLWYPPTGIAVDQVPTAQYVVPWTRVGYAGSGAATDDFLVRLLEKLRTDYPALLGSDFGSSFNFSGITFYGPGNTWPTNPQNAPWIDAWRSIDSEIAGRLGTASLADNFWSSFSNGAFGNVTIGVLPQSTTVTPVSSDQLGARRPVGSKGDIGAIEATR